METLDLGRAAKRANPRLTKLTMRPVEPTVSIEKDLYSVYYQIVKEWQTFITQELIPAYERPAPLVSDADGAQIQWLIDQKAADIANRIIYQTQGLQRWVTRFGEWHTKRTAMNAWNASGVPVDSFLRMSDIQPILEASIRENVSLISGLNAETKKRVEQIIFEGFALRKTKAEITKSLAEAMGITQRRARSIAGDQTHKLNSLLTGLRQKQLGFNKYLWRTRRDDRVRKLHREREGKTFSWDNPPSDGHPGWPINCRCVAEAYKEL